MVTGVPGGHARTELAGTRFANVRWVDETGSTNADLMERARQGDAEGAVLVADHQSAGRGRAGRVWTAPPGAGLLMSILLRPPAEVMDSCTMAVAVSRSEEHASELQSLMRISYAVFCLKKKNNRTIT